MEGSASGAPVLAVLLVVAACAAFWLLLLVCRIERRLASTKYHMTEGELQYVISRANAKAVFEAKKELREELRRELGALDRDAARAVKEKKASSDSEEEGPKHGESNPRRGKKMHRAGRKHRKRSSTPKGDLGGRGGEEGGVEVARGVGEV